MKRTAPLAACLVAAGLMAAGLGFAATAARAAQTLPFKMGPRQDMCFTQQKCAGKFLGNVDARRCKSSGGRSWLNGGTGVCSNL